MPRPASNPPQRCMKLGFGGAMGGVVAAGAGCAGFADCVGAAGVELGVASRCVGTARCLPRLPPPPKRRAASPSIEATPSESPRITKDHVFFIRYLSLPP